MIRLLLCFLAVLMLTTLSVQVGQAYDQPPDEFSSVVITVGFPLLEFTQLASPQAMVANYFDETIRFYPVSGGAQEVGQPNGSGRFAGNPPNPGGVGVVTPFS